MIERSPTKEKHDRLAAFLQAYGLRAQACSNVGDANLLIVDAAQSGLPTRLIYRPRSGGTVPASQQIMAAAVIDFAGSINPLVGALPDELSFNLELEPQISGLCDLIVSESMERRCGDGTIHARLCEVVVVLAIRKAIAIGTVDAGLLAGLTHHELHASLVAMHDRPDRAWKVAELADVAGMRRGRFIDVFTRTVGAPPLTYLTGWRLALARVELRAGRSVKVVASMVGFGSAAAFSRAFSRRYGYAPSLEGVREA